MTQITGHISQIIGPVININDAYTHTSQEEGRKLVPHKRQEHNYPLNPAKQTCIAKHMTVDSSLGVMLSLGH